MLLQLLHVWYCTGATRPHTHSCSHQASRRSSCCSTIWLHSKSLLSHRPSKISRSRISLKHNTQSVCTRGHWFAHFRQVLSPTCDQAGPTAHLVKQTRNQSIAIHAAHGARLWAEGEGGLSHLSGEARGIQGGCVQFTFSKGHPLYARGVDHRVQGAVLMQPGQ